MRMKLLPFLLVYTVIVVFLTMLTTSYRPKQNLEQNDNRRKTDLLLIQNALERYYDDHGYYPKVDKEWLFSTSTSKNWIPDLESYLPEIPKDPKNTGCASDPYIAKYELIANDSACYAYGYTSVAWQGMATGSYYALSTRLEADHGITNSVKAVGYDEWGNQIWWDANPENSPYRGRGVFMLGPRVPHKQDSTRQQYPL